MDEILNLLQYARPLYEGASFNAWRDEAYEDQPGALVARRERLSVMLRAVKANEKPVSLWLGEEGSYRTCSATGLPLTAVPHLSTANMRWRLGGDIAEHEKFGGNRVSDAVWDVLEDLLPGENILLWNLFPFQPHRPGDRLRNRKHTWEEFQHCKHILLAVLEEFQPARVIAIGKRAAARCYNIDEIKYHTAVRNPIGPGREGFLQGIADAYNLADT